MLEAMGLRQAVMEKLKEAMKAKDEVRVRTLRLLNAALLELEKSGQEVTEERELQVVLTSVKKRREAIEQYEKAGRQDLAEQEKAELQVLEEFLPKQLSEEELRREIARIIEEVGATSIKDFGRVMQAAMKVLRGKAEGKQVQQVVRQLLSSE